MAVLDTCQAAPRRFLPWRRSHTEMVRYAHDHGCPWGEYTCPRAARGGYLDVLRYAHEHGSPLKEETCLWVLRGTDEIDHWVWDDVTRMGAQRRVSLSEAQVKFLEVLRYAHAHGCPWKVASLRNMMRAP